MSNRTDGLPATLAPRSQIDLESLGLSDVAYLRRAEIDGVEGYAIHAANGVPIGFAPAEMSAIAAVITHNLAVAAVH